MIILIFRIALFWHYWHESESLKFLFTCLLDYLIQNPDIYQYGPEACVLDFERNFGQGLW